MHRIDEDIRGVRMTISWGIFSPDHVGRMRRLQTLELAAAVRHYNERSVPGLGGLWFGMPLAWSLFGISLSERVAARPLPTANAIEAGVMLQAIQEGLKRARGIRKLAGLNALSFKDLSRRGAYVTQPYRMVTVEPLLQLGFVEGSGQRFNLYRLSEIGEAFIKPFEREKEVIRKWAEGSELRKLTLLMPNKSLPRQSAELLLRQLRDHGDGARRRRAMLDLGSTSFEEWPLDRISPARGLDGQHWQDMRSGIALIRLREAAIRVLDVIENEIRRKGGLPIGAETVVKASKTELELLREAANEMLALEDSSPGQLGHRFAEQCGKNGDRVISELARRDGAVVRLAVDGKLGLGPAGQIAARRNAAADSDEPDPSITPDTTNLVPELPRIANLYALREDLKKSAVNQ